MKAESGSVVDAGDDDAGVVCALHACREKDGSIAKMPLLTLSYVANHHGRNLVLYLRPVNNIKRERKKNCHY